MAVTSLTSGSVRNCPDVPTFTEAGSPLSELDTGAVWGIVGPAGLPRIVVVSLNDAINKALAAREIRARLAALNMDPLPGTPEAFADFINKSVATWAQVLKRAEIKRLD